MIALACVALLGACGGDDGEEDVEGLLDRAFRQSIASADLKFDAQLSLDGLKGFERPVRLRATGPYIPGGSGLPKLDIDLNLGAQGAGQNVQFGLLRTGGRAFVKFGGEFYEQPRREVRRANRELGNPRGQNGSLRELGVAPRTWVVGARHEGDEKVAGVDTNHVSGKLDMRSLLRDLNGLVGRSGSVVGASPADVPDPLSSQELDELAETVRNPSFDVYVGKDDDAIRRLSVQLEVRVPEKDQASVGGIQGGALRVSIEFSELGGEQVVKTPAKARPIGDLIAQLGGLSGLASLGVPGDDAGGTRDGGETPAARDGRSEGTKPGAPPAGAGEESGDGVEAFRRYSDCLDKANPDDTRALSRCVELLR